MIWNEYEHIYPTEKLKCVVLVDLKNGQLKEEEAIYYPDLGDGMFVMIATPENCGKTATILYWKEKIEKNEK